MRNDIRFVYFDIGDVVVDNIAAKNKVAREFGKTVDEVVAYLDGAWEGPCRGDVTSEEYMREFKEKLDIVHPKTDFSDFWSDQLRPIFQTHALIRDLVGVYRLGILSNAENNMLKLSLAKGNIPTIEWDVIIESASVGVIKPEREIYEIAETKAGVNPGEIFFVDDNKKNIEAARVRGWQVTQFNPHDVDAEVNRLRRILLP